MLKVLRLLVDASLLGLATVSLPIGRLTCIIIIRMHLVRLVSNVIYGGRPFRRCRAILTHLLALDISQSIAHLRPIPLTRISCKEGSDFAAGVACSA